MVGSFDQVVIPWKTMIDPFVAVAGVVVVDALYSGSVGCLTLQPDPLAVLPCVTSSVSSLGFPVLRPL